MDSHRDQIDFAAELRALRPAPRPAFAARLDARVGAGFMPAPDAAGSPLSRLAGRLRMLQGRRLLIPAGAVATVAIVAATALVISSESGSPDDRRLAAVPAATRPSRGQTLEQLKAFSAAANAKLSSPRTVSPSVSSSGAEGVSPQLSGEIPLADLNAASGEASLSFDGAGRYATPRGNVGPYAVGVAHRNIERSAQIVLGDDPADVRSDAAKVFDAVRAFHGIVLRSSISDGGEGEAGATFNLLIPSGKLGEAMGAFSGIADVRSRHETGVDVTAPTISLGERLQDARAKVDSLLAELAGAETEEDREAAEEKLQAARRDVARLRSRLMNLRRQTHLSSVFLRIETGGAAAEGGGSWGVGDGLDEASHIIAVAAGVTVIALAILAPLALIVLLAWLARRAWVTRSRERALGG